MIQIMSRIKCKQIGIIHSPFKEPEGTPIQARAVQGIDGTVELFRKYTEGLKDVDGFSHIILAYHFYLSKDSLLSIVPFMDDKSYGVFSTKVPNRPNPIGISVVQLVKIDGNILQVKDLDIVDWIPLTLNLPTCVEFIEIQGIHKD